MQVKQEVRDARKKKTAEVFTPPEMVNHMLDKLPPEAWQENKTFLEPTAGNGNFVLAILKRKIEIYHHDPLKALSTIYAVELMADNVQEMKDRIKEYISSFTKDIKKVNEILDTNIVCADALTYDYSFIPDKKKGLLKLKMFKMKS